MKNAVQPIILIGSHRSGTTMVTKILRDLGLFIGWDYEENLEANFFLMRNDRLLIACGGSWDNPNVLDDLINTPDMMKKVVSVLNKDLSSFVAFSYIGPKYYLKYRSLKNLDIPWGWKDPRNVFLLPLWLDIFPQAKIIHIYRHGVDVAHSLKKREVKRLSAITNNNRESESILPRQIRQLERDGALLYILRKVQNRYKKNSPLQKYEQLGIYPCISLERGFKLWCVYVQKALEVLERFDNDSLTIKYEDILLNPKDHVQELMKFCNVRNTDQTIERVIQKLDKSRRYAFKNSPSLKIFYESVKDHYLLKRIGYIYE